MSKYSAVLALCCSLFVCACAPQGTLNVDPAGNTAAGDQTSEVADAGSEDSGKQEAAEPESAEPADTVREEEPEFVEDASDDKGEGRLHFTTIDGKSADNAPANDDVHEDGELTQRELNIIGRDLNSDEYYGFLMSDYDDPKFIDWNEVLYNGAGIDEGYPTGDVEKEYLRQTGEFEIYTDVTVISGEKLEKFVEETTGLPYSKMRNPLDWVYLKNMDLYLYEHGDTNKINVEVISGNVEDGTFYIRYKHNNWWGQYADYEYTVAFTKNGDRYCFISNLPDMDSASFAASADYLIPDSDSRYITEEDIEGMDNETLRLARNEIFARYGRKFSDNKLQAYFDAKSWYEGTLEPDEITESSLNKFEAYNVKFIKKYEKQ